MTFARSARLLMAGAAFLTLAGPAFSLDTQDLLAKINAAYASSAGKIEAKTIDVSGSDVTLRETTFTPNGAAAKPVPVGDVEMTGVTAESDGSYLIEKITLPNVDVTEEKSRVTISDIYVSGVYIPADTKGDTLASMLLYDEAHSGTIRVLQDGKEVLSVAESTASLMQYEDETGLEFEGSLTGIKADMTAVQDPASKDQIEKLGLQKLEGDVTTKGSWEVASGAFDIEAISFDFGDVGRLDVALGLSGFTMPLLKEFQKTAENLEKPGDEAAQQAAGMAMLGLAQQMSFSSAEISFADAGITQRALDYAGAQQGQTGEQMKQMVKGMVPLLLAQFKLAELQTSVSTAVNAYLDDPKNITISAAPEAPVPFPMIMGAAMGAPETLVKVLGIAVTSNE